MLSAKVWILATSLLLPFVASTALGQEFEVGELPFEAELNDLEAFTTDLESLEPITDEDTQLLHLSGEAGNYVQFNGPATLFSREVFEVDPEAAYRISADVRSVKDDPSVGGTQGFIGVVTYDENGELLTGGPGIHRYPAWSGRVLQQQPSGEWTKFEGVIEGEGNEGHNQFREGTAYVRLVVLLNYESPEALSQLDNLRLEKAD